MAKTLRKLHLGCFDQVLPGWINTDITPHIFVSRIPGLALLLCKAGVLSQLRYQQHKQGIFRAVRYLDVTKRFPYRDGKFNYVFCAHLLEHLYHDQMLFCLSEIYRVLNEGGLVRIEVPDLDQIVGSYDPAHPDAFLEEIFEAKQKRDKNRHRWHYNETSLTRILNQVGFCEVRRWQFQQGRCADVASIDTRPQSLFLEAIKQS